MYVHCHYITHTKLSILVDF